MARYRSLCAHVADFYDHLALRAMNDQAEFDGLWNLAWFYHDCAEHGTATLGGRA